AIRIFLNISNQCGHSPIRDFKTNVETAASGCPPGAARLWPASPQTQEGAREARLIFRRSRPQASLLRPNHKQLLPIFDGLAVASQLLHDFTGHVGLYLIQ